MSKRLCFDRDKPSIFEGAGLTPDEIERIVKAAQEVMNESMDMAIMSEIKGPDGEVVGQHGEGLVSFMEITQAICEALDRELTPEIGFVLCLLVQHEMNNQERHAEYLAQKHGGRPPLMD